MKLTQLARGQSCVLCGKNDGTIVAAHINGPLSARLGRGMGIKPHDLFAAHLCHQCHDQLDSRVMMLEPEERQRLMYEAVLLTINRLLQDGAIKV